MFSIIHTNANFIRFLKLLILISVYLFLINRIKYNDCFIIANRLNCLKPMYTRRITFLFIYLFASLLTLNKIFIDIFKTYFQLTYVCCIFLHWTVFAKFGQIEYWILLVASHYKECRIWLPKELKLSKTIHFYKFINIWRKIWTNCMLNLVAVNYFVQFIE